MIQKKALEIVISITKQRLAHAYSPRNFPTGATAMAGIRWTGKRRALVFATFTLACVAFLSRVAAPKPVSIAELGSNWQCSKTAFVLTTCTRVRPFNGTAQNPDDEVASRDDDWRSRLR